MKRLIIFPAIVGILCIAILVALPDHVRVQAQSGADSPFVPKDSGHVALGLALRKLNVSGTFMQAPAHPDDENNALLAMFAHGMGLRTIDVQNNRAVVAGKTKLARSYSGTWRCCARPSCCRRTASMVPSSILLAPSIMAIPSTLRK